MIVILSVPFLVPARFHCFGGRMTNFLNSCIAQDWFLSYLGTGQIAATLQLLTVLTKDKKGHI